MTGDADAEGDDDASADDADDNADDGDDNADDAAVPAKVSCRRRRKEAMVLGNKKKGQNFLLVGRVREGGGRKDGGAREVYFFPVRGRGAERGGLGTRLGRGR